MALLGLQTGGKINGYVKMSNAETWSQTNARAVLDLEINVQDEKVMRLKVDASDWIGLATWDEADDVLVIGEYNNSTSLRPIRITSGTTTLSCGRASTLGGGELIFGQGLFLGASRGNARHMTNGTVAPSSGEHGRGETVWNRNASAGAVLGWVCVSAGTPGTWVEIRGVANQTSGAGQAALTNSTGGVGDGTLSVVGDTSTADQSATINDNLTELHTLLDEMRTTLVNFGLMKGGV